MSVVLLLATLGIIVGTQPQGKHVSISEHAASRRWSYLVFACSLSIFGSVLLFYLLRSFGPEFGLPVTYYVALFAGWVFLFLTAWIPDRGFRTFTNVHWKAAYGLACCMTIIIASLAGTGRIALFIRLISLVVSIWYCYTLYIWKFTTKGSHQFLVFQAVNISSFMGLLALTLIFR